MIRPQAVRIARHTEQLDAMVTFYRDGLGLREVGRFGGHAGYDGVFLELPGTGAHLEFTAGGEQAAPTPHPESLLVLYLGDRDAVDATLRRAAVAPVAPANPYWAAHGVTVTDPDGFGVVLVPERWRPDPLDVEVHLHEGSRREVRHLFELAEDSRSQLDGYIDAGRLLVARLAEAVVGHLQLIEASEAGRGEIKNMAVLPSHQGRGIGRALVHAAFDLARTAGWTQLAVATAAADIGNLSFYQRLGFRLQAVEHDAFTPATGYAAASIDGLELRDRVWLERAT